MPPRVVGLVATTGALVAPPLAPAPAPTTPAAAPLARPAIAVSDRHLRFGDRVVVTGHLPAHQAGERVLLQLRPAHARWHTLRSAAAKRNGRFRLSAAARRSGSVRVVRVSSDRRLEAADSRGAERVASRLHAISVAARVERLRQRLDVLGGERATVSGRLAPGRRGRVVVLQRRSHGRWRAIARAHTRRDGRFTLRTAPQRAMGSARVRVRFAGDRLNAAAVRRGGRLTVFRATQASYYGPGLYGSGLACGGHLTPGTLGVAHKSLPCGTLVTFRYHGRQVRVPVIDRGPYVSGREWDLTTATRNRLGFGDVGVVWSSR